MSIRHFETSDYEAIFEIYADSKLDELRFEKNQFEFVPLNEDERRYSEFRESEVFVYEESEVLGYGAILGAQVKSVFVHSKARGKGIGNSILKYLLSKIKGDVYLNVAKSNAPAKALYKKFGFEVVNEFTTSYNGVNAVANTMVLKKDD